MPRRRIMLVFVGLLVVSGAARGTTPLPAPGVDAGWTLQRPATERVTYRLGPSPRPPATEESPFRFSDDADGLLKRLPPRPMDREAVLGAERAWIGGRPPLECSMTPHDARCH